MTASQTGRDSSQAGRGPSQSARKRLQPVGQKRLQQARKRLQPARRKIQPVTKEKLSSQVETPASHKESPPLILRPSWHVRSDFLGVSKIEGFVGGNVSTIYCRETPSYAEHISSRLLIELK